MGEAQTADLGHNELCLKEIMTQGQLDFGGSYRSAKVPSLSLKHFEDPNTIQV